MKIRFSYIVVICIFIRTNIFQRIKDGEYVGKVYVEHSIYLPCIFDMLSLNTQ